MTFKRNFLYCSTNLVYLSNQQVQSIYFDVFIIYDKQIFKFKY